METELEKLKRQMLDDFHTGKIELPSMPDIVFKIREALYDSRRSFNDIARVVQLDTALAARLIQVANSPIYRGTHPIENCKNAIARLGTEVTRNIVTGIVLRSAYQSKNPKVQKMISQSWHQSCQVGALSHVIASFCTGIRHDRAMLAGQIHNIGVLPLLNFLQKRPELMNQPRLLQQTIRLLQGKLGTLLLKHWRFEEDFIPIPELSRNSHYVSAGEGVNFIEVVIVARLHMRLYKSQDPAILEEIQQAPAFKKMSIGQLGPDASLQLLDEAKDEIEQLIRALN
ncbi:MAG: HDOD domain-containing protein [Gammaproteobacteria bacterium]|nr:HDOD domain-containing protein [Gammaproteobacteria bacterium]